MDDLLIRPVELRDLPGLVALAGHLDSINLPRDPALLTHIIDRSVGACAALLTGVADPSQAAYTLVAEADGRLLGTATVFARHGTPEDPHYHLVVEEQTVHSRQLDTDRQRTLLRLERDTTPWTELGGLVVAPEARGRGLGKLLVAARLLLVARFPERFCDRLLAELLPQRRPDGGNAFWDAVGGPLTGLDFYRADLLCRTDKEFIEAFFPHDHLVADLLPAAARAHIAHEGPATTPVRDLLERAGLQWLGTIDPFDGGPHVGASLAAVGPVQRMRRLVELDVPWTGDPPPMALVAEAGSLAARPCPVAVVGAGVRLPPGGDRAARPGTIWHLLPLDW